MSCLCFFMFYIFFYFFESFKYNCLHFPHTAHPHPTYPCLPPYLLPTLAFFMCPLYCSLVTLPLFSLIIPLPQLLWLLSVCSLFQCLWLYFASLFLLLIMFQLKVRSYDIHLSLPGLFHLA